MQAGSGRRVGRDGLPVRGEGGPAPTHSSFLSSFASSCLVSSSLVFIQSRAVLDHSIPVRALFRSVWCSFVSRVALFFVFLGSRFIRSFTTTVCPSYLYCSQFVLSSVPPTPPPLTPIGLAQRTLPRILAYDAYEATLRTGCLGDLQRGCRRGWVLQGGVTRDVSREPSPPRSRAFRSPCYVQGSAARDAYSKAGERKGGKALIEDQRSRPFHVPERGQGAVRREPWGKRAALGGAGPEAC